MDPASNINMRPNVQDCQERNDQISFDTTSKTKNLSRRSIDWRDSGIVIDEDNHLLFPSFDTLYHFDTRSSIQSECNHHPAQTTTTTTTTTPFSHCCPSQRIAHEQSGEDDDGDTILHLAVVGFTLERVKDLIKLCDLNAINNMMQSPLHVAVLANRPEMVQLLVESGAHIKVHDRRGDTPLHVACQRGLVEIVDIILTAQHKRAPQNHNDQMVAVQGLIETSNFDGLTCLHLAALNDRRNIMDFLVSKYKANLNARDSKSGETIMHKAIRQFNVDLVGFILNLESQHCNDSDYSGREPLSTIRMLQDSQSVDANQLERLFKIKVLVKRGVEECLARRGCCLARQQERAKRLAGNSLDSSDESSSSSSDYGDSDYEMS